MCVLQNKTKKRDARRGKSALTGPTARHGGQDEDPQLHAQSVHTECRVSPDKKSCPSPTKKK